MSSPERIASGRILHLWWSFDSETLFYELPGRPFAYSISDQQSRALPADSPALVNPKDEFLSHLPVGAECIGVSPGGDLALYLIPVEPTPTVPPLESPQDQGEVWRGGEQSELWLWDGEKSTRMGQMENCVDQCFWGEDEKRVVISALPAPAVCLEARAWLVDLDHGTVTLLFPVGDFPADPVAYGISPDGERLLYRYEGSLFTIELDTLAVSGVDAPKNSMGQWLSDQELLILYRMQSAAPWAFGIYYLPSSELREIVGPLTTPFLDGMRFRWAQVSPDRKRLAFAAGDSFYEMDSLWLMRIDRGR